MDTIITFILMCVGIFVFVTILMYRKKCMIRSNDNLSIMSTEIGRKIYDECKMHDISGEPQYHNYIKFFKMILSYRDRSSFDMVCRGNVENEYHDTYFKKIGRSEILNIEHDLVEWGYITCKTSADHKLRIDDLKDFDGVVYYNLVNERAIRILLKNCNL